MPKAAIKSIFKEVQQMVDKRVWKGHKVTPVSFKHQKKIIKSFMFLKEKFKSDGSFEKRMVQQIGGFLVF
jgi:hypothetical protein